MPRSTAVPARPRPLSRLIAFAALGILLAGVGCAALSSFVGRASTLSGPIQNSVTRVLQAGDRSHRSAVLDLRVGDVVSATQEITVRKDDPLVSLVADGTYAQDPQWQVDLFGFVDVERPGGAYLNPVWREPTVTSAPGADTVTIASTLRTSSASTLRGPLTVTTTKGNVAATTISLESTHWDVVGVTGLRTQARTDRSVIALASDARPLAVVLRDRNAAPVASQSPNRAAWVSFRNWFAVTTLTMLPWLVLVLTRRRRGSATRPIGPRPTGPRWRALDGLAGGLAFLAGAQSLYFVGTLFAVNRFTPTGFGAFATPVTAIGGLVVIWVWSILPDPISVRSGSEGGADRRRRRQGALSVTAFVVALVVAGGALWFFVGPLRSFVVVLAKDATAHGGDAYYSYLASILWFSGVAAGVGVLCLVASSLLLVSVFRVTRRWSAVILSVGVELLACVASITGEPGPANVAARYAVVVLAGFALAALVDFSMRRVPVPRPWMRWAAVGVVAALTLFFLWPRASAANPLGGAAYDSLSFSYTLQSCLVIALVFVLVAAVTGGEHVTPRWRWGAIAILSIVLLLRLQNVPNGVPLSLLVGLPLVFGLLLPGLPSRVVAPGVLSLRGDRHLIPESTAAFLEEIGASRLARETANALRAKLAGAELSGDEEGRAQATVASQRRAPRTTAALRRARAAGLGWGGTADPWARAWNGLLVATLVGIPLATPTLATTIGNLGQYQGAGSLGSLLSIGFSFRFPLYGFAFGLLFPVLRGAGGIEKAFRLFVVLGITEAIVVLIPFSSGAGVGSALVLRLAQLAATCVVLGLWFDYRSLRGAGLGLDRLGDLYAVNRLAVWSSGVGVTIAATALTAVLAPTAEAALHRFLPTVASTSVSPPPQTSGD